MYGIIFVIIPMIIDRMNMPLDSEGKVHFTTTLFALIRWSSSWSSWLSSLGPGPSPGSQSGLCLTYFSIKISWLSRVLALTSCVSNLNNLGYKYNFNYKLFFYFAAQGEPEYQDALGRGDGPGTVIIIVLVLLCPCHISVLVMSLYLSFPSLFKNSSLILTHSGWRRAERNHP